MLRVTLRVLLVTALVAAAVGFPGISAKAVPTHICCCITVCQGLPDRGPGEALYWCDPIQTSCTHPNEPEGDAECAYWEQGSFCCATDWCNQEWSWR
jgi:hypothetical protein